MVKYCHHQILLIAFTVMVVKAGVAPEPEILPKNSSPLDFISFSRCDVNPGIDLNTYYTNDIYGCYEACSNYTGCLAFVFESAHPLANCYLKSNRALVPTTKDTVAGLMPYSGQCYLQPRFDITPGQDLAAPFVADVAECCSRCQQNSNCRGFTYDQGGSGANCFLKSNATVESTSKLIVAGVL